MTSFAYIHCKPDGTPFYVGKGSLRRARYLGERNPHHKSIVTKYGKNTILVGMMECSSSNIAFELERGIIKCLRRQGAKLSNCTDGGEGGLNPTPETRLRLSAAAKKRGVSEACHAAKVAAKSGVPLSDSQKKKQSEAMKGAVFTEQHRLNISKAAKKRGMSPALLAAAHKAAREREHSEEEKIKRRDAMLLYWDKKGRKVTIPKLVKGNCWDTRKPRAIAVDGLVYRTMKAAAQSINSHSAAIIYALKHTGVVKGHKITEVHNDD